MVELHQSITCLMNPTGGREAEWGEGSLTPAPVRRRVLVVGGGPAGLEAARVAAARGHDVTLWERAPEVGGQVNVAARIGARSEFTYARTYFEEQCRAQKVRVECGIEASAARVLAFHPDAVILATGARPKPLTIPGAKRVLTVWDALLEPEAVGSRVAVIEADGNWPGVATAEHLADLGKTVTLITGGTGYGARITIYSMLAVRQRFRDKRIRIMPLRAVRAVENGALILEDVSTGASERLDGIDTIIAAAGGEVEDGLARELRGRVPELRMAGDCVAPRTALEAIFEGHAAGRAV